MTHHVVMLPRARRQLYESAMWWSEHRSAKQTARWVDGFEEVLSTLQEDPERFALAPEDDAFSFTVRQLLFGLGRHKTHRAVFEVRDNQVLIHAIRHFAQADLVPNDL